MTLYNIGILCGAHFVILLNRFFYKNSFENFH
jgi:hypothetical protein